MEKKGQILGALLFVVIAILLFALFYLYIELKSEGSKCVANPSGYFYSGIKKSNPSAFITCSCTLSKEGSSAIMYINETGANWVNNNVPIFNWSYKP